MNPHNPTTANDGVIAFQKKLINHTIIQDAIKKLTDHLRAKSGHSLAIVQGPTGVGKTTLINKIEKTMRQEYSVEMESNPGLVPFCKVEAPAADNGKFNWRDFYERTLRVLDEPCVEKKSILCTYGSPSACQVQKATSGCRTKSCAALRVALEQCLRYRGTKILVIDEAQHLNKANKQCQRQEAMDVIKSLANLSNVFIVLVGTYDLLYLTSLSGQLARRTVNIHFRRYLPDSTNDMENFRHVLRTFQKELPFKEPSDLVSQCDFLYSGCHGCVGILKSWLNEAVSLSVVAGDKSLTVSSLKKTILSSGSRNRILEEINDGEDKFAEKEPPDFTNEKIEPVAKTSENKPKSNFPFQRKPNRDPVGLS